MTKFQVSHTKQPQVNFGQLPLVPTCQKHKGKEPIFDQTPKEKIEIEFTPHSNLIKLNIPRPSSLLSKTCYSLEANIKVWRCLIIDVNTIFFFCHYYFLSWSSQNYPIEITSRVSCTQVHSKLL